jgi:hypothetical protein
MGSRNSGRRKLDTVASHSFQGLKNIEESGYFPEIFMADVE